MAILPATRRQTTSTIARQLYTDGQRFDFYQAVRLLEWLHPEAIPPGLSSAVVDEVVRFHAIAGFTFPTTDVIQVMRGQRLHELEKHLGDTLDRQICPPELRQKMAQQQIYLPEAETTIVVEKEGEHWQVIAPTTRQYLYIEREGERLQVYDDGRATMQVNFLGIAGATGPLPTPYTELLLERLRNGDTVLRDFLDIFNHRLISLLYQVRKRYRAAFDIITPGRDRFSNILFSLIGLGHQTLRNRLSIPDAALLPYTTLLAQETRSAIGLEQLLCSYFELTIRVHQFVGQWRSLASEERTTIGQHGANQRLGKGFLLGQQVYDLQTGIDVSFTKLTFQQFVDFLPIGKGYQSLVALVHFYMRDEFELTVHLGLKDGVANGFRLGGHEDSRLGWTSWLQIGEKPIRNAMLRIPSRSSLSV